MKRALCLAATLFVAVLNLAHADGTIALPNSIGTRFDTACVPNVPLNIGVFLINPDGSETLVLPLASCSATTGLITSPSILSIPGTDAGQIVPLRIRGWSADYGTNWPAAMQVAFASTDVRQVTLGPETGPGTVIWQGATGIFPSRFLPLDFCSLTGPILIMGLPSQTIAEGSNGVVEVKFFLSVEHSSDVPYPKLVDFSTVSVSAMAGQDFVPTNGTLTFQTGEITKTVSVYLTPDAAIEPDEQFTFALSNPRYIKSGGTQRITCTITDARILGVHREDADVVVTFHSVQGRRYAVEYSAQLPVWNPVQGAGDVTGIGGSMTIRDVGAGSMTNRLYRLRLF